MTAKRSAEPFEDLYGKLEQTVEELEKGGLSLEESIALYEEGMGLAKRCQTLLDDAELRITKLKESFAFCQSALNQLDDAKLAEQTTMTFGNNTRQVSRAQMALGHALDLADHYSQLANYMRLNGILPPTAQPRPGRGGGAGR